MKNLKKLSGILLAIAVLLACTVSAFAAETQQNHGTSANVKGEITIDNPIDGESYNVYKMFDLESYNKDTKVYSYKVSGTEDPWYEFVNTGAGSEWFSVDDQYYVTLKEDVTIADNSDIAAKVAKAALEFVKTKNQAQANTIPLVATLTSSVKTATNLALGYYVVDSSLGTLCDLTTTNNVIKIKEKNTAPTVDKVIDDGSSDGTDNNTVSVGDTIKYKTTINAYAGAANYVLYDTMDSGLTLDQENITIKDGTKVLEKDTDYTISTTAHSFTITFKPTYLNTITGVKGTPTKIVVSYKAVLNENAVTRGEYTDPATEGSNKNSTYLKYSDTGEKITVPKTTNTYTYKFDLVKTDSNDKVIQNAKFELYTDAGCAPENKVKLVADAKGYRVATETEANGGSFTSETIVAGNVEIRGLKGDTTYYLKEIAAPDGYNKLSGPVEVPIIAADLEATVTGDTFTGGSIRVVNKAGTILPSTGGIGTTIFYIVGGVLVAAAVVLLVAKKRTSENR